jgi:hypothetical protein
VLTWRFGFARDGGDRRDVRVRTVSHVDRVRRTWSGRRSARVIGLYGRFADRDRSRIPRPTVGRRHGRGRRGVTIMDVRDGHLSRGKEAEVQHQHQRGAAAEQGMATAHLT